MNYDAMQATGLDRCLSPYATSGWTAPSPKLGEGGATGIRKKGVRARSVWIGPAPRGGSDSSAFPPNHVLLWSGLGGGAGGEAKPNSHACAWIELYLLARRSFSNMAVAGDVPVRVCNQEIVKFDLEIKAMVQDIRDCLGPVSTLTELNAKVKEKFQHLRLRIQELEQMAKEQDKESEKQTLLQEVENHKKQMLSNQTAWRKANLACKIAIDNAEKDELLRGGDPLRQRKSTKESLAEGASNITESLMSISRMMSQQVRQSEETMQTLVNSSRTILDASEEFKSMSGTIQLGRKLITKYNRRELTDKLLIFLALALFLATVLYILKKRLFPFL